jgi:putative chitinase
MTPAVLAACTGATLRLATNWLVPLTEAMGTFAINTPKRQVAFLPNVGHESGHLVYTREIWGPTDAQQRYEGRKDLANFRPGDGRRFMGRGPIQITGRFNYIATRDGLRKMLSDVPDFESMPELLEMPRWGALAAGLFWQTHSINAYADAGDFDGVCDVINRGRKTEKDGDANGYADRLALYVAAKAALGVA